MTSERETSPGPRSAMRTGPIWALVTGLAVGFVVGREMGRGGEAGGSAEESAPAESARPSAPTAAAPGAKAPAKVYRSQAEFPAGWYKDTDLAGVASVSLAGLTDAQKVTALQALNERNCECGCGMGSLAVCVKKDPNCPRSPVLGKLAIDAAKEGKTLVQVLAAIDERQKAMGGGAAAQPQAPAQPAGPKKVELAEWSPRKGPKATKVTIVEWSDFECPFCSRVGPTLKEIEQKYPKDVAVVFRHQPLSFHKNAMDAAVASMAAHKQGKFWEYHDKLFANQRALERTSLEKYAEELGLDMGRFRKDMDDPKVKQQVQDDSRAGNSVGANGTPTFFINGRELSGAQPFASFQSVIDEEIKKADELLKKGTPLPQVYGKLMEAAAAAPPPRAAAPAEPPKQVDIQPGDAPVKGPASAPITIIEFSEFQCPFCSRVGPTLKQLEDEYKGKVRIAFKHFPLSFHNNAQVAAEASLAAHEQGKFWEYHDKLFANQQALERASLEKYAQELGLNLQKFKAALDSGKFKSRVDADMKQGQSVGVSGTPAFFINGKFLSGAQPVDRFKSIIDEELKKKGK